MMRIHLSAILLLVGLVASASGAELRVSNRKPAPDEIGYRPANGATAALNPPSFAWLHEKEARTYTVQWAGDEAFASPMTADRVPWNTYTHDQPLTPGTYWWRYRFDDGKGGVSSWSVARRVVVPADAAALPMPTRAQQRQRVPAAHPRLFVRPEELPKLRELAAGREKDAFVKLRAAADKVIAAGPTPEPDKMGSARDKNNAELVKHWWPNRVQTMAACQEAETIAFVYLITQEKKYGEAARKWVVHLASWNPDGPTNFAMNCEAAKPLLYRLPRAYDWAYDALSDDDRAVVRKVMARRINDAWISGEIGRGVGHLNKPYSSHGNRTWHKVGEAGIALLGEVPEAEMWLDYAVNKFYACYPVWSDDDGGWHEGVGYWGGYMGKVVWWMQVQEKALGIDGLRKPFFAHVGDFPMYVAPPNAPNKGFGDLSHQPISRSTGEFLGYFIRATADRPSNAGYWRAWCDAWGMKMTDGGVIGFLYRASLPPLPPAKDLATLPPSKVFHGIGVAALNNTLTDARDGAQVLFKSSPFGTQSHGHNAHNTFQLNAYGEALLVANTYRDLHGSRFHYQYVHSTAAQNGVLVDGEGQIKHSAQPHGRIVASKLTKAWDYVVGDATAAYGGRLTKYRRHVVLLRPDTVILFDELTAAKPSTFQFMLHAPAEFALQEEARLAVAVGGAGVDVRYLSDAPLAFRQTDGFEPKPTKPFPNLWHVEASTMEKRESANVFTVMTAHRAGQAKKAQAERLGDRGVKLTIDGKETTITFGDDSVQVR